jgi:hypothetical protein
MGHEPVYTVLIFSHTHSIRYSRQDSNHGLDKRYANAMPMSHRDEKNVFNGPWLMQDAPSLRLGYRRILFMSQYLNPLTNLIKHAVINKSTLNL